MNLFHWLPIVRRLKAEIEGLHLALRAQKKYIENLELKYLGTVENQQEEPRQ